MSKADKAMDGALDKISELLAEVETLKIENAFLRSSANDTEDEVTE